eukprot:m.133599 g.133599  ORF g.133599 m.133599 type:complete len:693 (+) comp13944_c5_seq7:103-2181(+)
MLKLGIATRVFAKCWQLPSRLSSCARTVTINGKKVETTSDATILEAARSAEIEIPTLCYHPRLTPTGTCRMCLVSTGGKKLVPACTTKVGDVTEVHTHSTEIDKETRTVLQLLRARHPVVCATCPAQGDCELQTLLSTYDVDDVPFMPYIPRGGDGHDDTVELDTVPKPAVASCGLLAQGGTAHLERGSIHGDDLQTGGCQPIRFNKDGLIVKDTSSPAIVLDLDKCVLCTRCVRACHELQGMDILGVVSRGTSELVQPPMGQPIASSKCISCGACSAVCPVGAITEVPHHHQVAALLRRDTTEVRMPWEDSGQIGHEGGDEQAQEPLITVVQAAPAVRVTIGEAFDLEPGQVSTGQLVTALKSLGFDYVFDTNFTADLTIMEEATELLGRLKTGKRLPLFTSCCPGWINLVEKTYPNLIPHLSTTRSPQQMLGSVAKTVFAKRIGVDASRIRVVSLMPCTAKKDEAQRKEQRREGTSGPDVDYVLTTRELAKLIKQHRPKLHFHNLPETPFDSVFGESTGAGAIFGVTGGVMEAALRTAIVVTSKESETPKRLEFHEVRGLHGVKEATVDVNGMSLRVAVVHGGRNIVEVAKRCAEDIEQGRTPPYDFVEMMACEGGCIGGGGNPKDAFTKDLLERRAKGIYSIDEQKAVRRSHENKEVQQLYQEELDHPASKQAHALLHTRYSSKADESP